MLRLLLPVRLAAEEILAVALLKVEVLVHMLRLQPALPSITFSQL